MRLLEAKTLALHEFFGDAIPAYAILSHTWGKEEVTFQEWTKGNLGRLASKKKAGFAKIQGACTQALKRGLDWVWVDTCCIDKSSSAELSEAINSMYQWYSRSQVCFAYLSDMARFVEAVGVPELDEPDAAIRRSRWWTRGWTLQELLAPANVVFFAADWSVVGRKTSDWLAYLITEITGIDVEYLQRPWHIRTAPAARKMSWLARQTTTRAEDMAYCMLGLFDIHMPLLYGEGTKAFTRLQHEIIKTSNDHTIFCWAWSPAVPSDWTSLLAPSPSQFLDSEEWKPSAMTPVLDETRVSIYSMTNAGLSIRLPVVYALKIFYVVLQVAHNRSGGTVALPLEGHRKGDVLHVARFHSPGRPVVLQAAPLLAHLQTESLLVIERPLGNRRAFAWRGVHAHQPKAKAPVTNPPDDTDDDDDDFARRHVQVQQESIAMVLVFDAPDFLHDEWGVAEMRSFPAHALDWLSGTLLLRMEVKKSSGSETVIRAAMLQLRPRDWLPQPENDNAGEWFPSDGPSDNSDAEEADQINHTNNTNSRAIYIFVALREREDAESGNSLPNTLVPYCQIFNPIDRRNLEEEEGWEENFFAQLREQVLRDEPSDTGGQPAHYSADLDLSAVLDMRNFDPHEGFPFLRISRGQRRIIPAGSWVSDYASAVELDSNVALAGDDGAVFVPYQGILTAPYFVEGVDVGIQAGA